MEKLFGGVPPHINHSDGKGGSQGGIISPEIINGIDDDGDGQVDE